MYLENQFYPHIWCRQVSIHLYACDFVCTTMQQSVEQSWSKLHGDVSRSTLYCSIQGSLSRTSFSTFQSVSYKRNVTLFDIFDGSREITVIIF